MAALFYSCNLINDEKPEFGDVVSLGLCVCFLDGTFNDRLNPESPSYFGDEFINNTKIIYTADDSKSKYLIPCTKSCYLSEGIKPPFRWVVDDRYQGGGYYTKENSRGYYFLPCGGGGDIKIYYPDGSEDEIKVEIWESEDTRVMCIGKVWINDELVYEIGFFRVKEHYYNPKYFPFMKPLFDDDGKQYGEAPDYGNFLTLTFVK